MPHSDLFVRPSLCLDFHLQTSKERPSGEDHAVDHGRLIDILIIVLLVCLCGRLNDGYKVGRTGPKILSSEGRGRL